MSSKNTKTKSGLEISGSDFSLTTGNGARTLREIDIQYNRAIPISNDKVTKSADANKLLRKQWDKIGLVETFYVMHLQTDNRIIGIQKVSSGGIRSTVVDARIIFSAAIKAFSANILLAHNHPSGSLKPSSSDKKLTRQLKQAGEILDISLFDHIILAPSGEYFSFQDEGIF